MKRVLVTGAQGFVGRHALPELLNRGYEVHAICREGSVTGVTSHRCDLMDSRSVRALLDQIRPSHLLHFAWYTEHGRFWTSPENLSWVAASLQLLRDFQESGGKRVVFAGTCAEYDWSKGGTLSERSTPLQPSTLYGVSKAALWQVYEKYCEQSGLSAAWGRIFFLYGPDEVASRLVPSAILPLLHGQVAEFTHGLQIRDFMYVDDVARAFVHVLDGDFKGPINIASGEPVRLRDVVEKIAQKLQGENRVRFGARPASPVDPERLVADVSTLRERLRFEPKYSLDEGLERTIEWWRKKI